LFFGLLSSTSFSKLLRVTPGQLRAKPGKKVEFCKNKKTAKLDYNAKVKRCFMAKKVDISCPASVTTVLETLSAAPESFQAFLVGGCVRDALMGAIPHDFDVTTNASTKQIRTLFPKTIAVGEYFGVTVVIPEDGSEPIEVASFRKEEGTLDGRHPESVSFNCTVKEDLARRDLTINAMAVDLEGNLVDPFGGEKDLKAKLVKTVGDPLKRFAEDYLRILRVFRFSAKLAFTIEPKTLAAASALSAKLALISKERIGQELNKLLATPTPGKTVEVMLAAKIFTPLIPELQEYSEKKPGFAATLFQRLDTLPPFMRLGALIQATEGTVTSGKLKGQLMLTNEEASLAKNIAFLLETFEKTTSEFSVRQAMAKTNKTLVSTVAGALDENLAATVAKVLASQACTSLKELALNGEDLLAAGLKGKELGKKLNELLAFVLENPSANNKALLLNKIKTN
jgi:tRNA nucleotidyltransferase (CCA-adding enzyme)